MFIIRELCRWHSAISLWTTLLADKAGLLFNTFFWVLQDCKRAIAYKVTPYQGHMQPGAVVESTPSPAASLQGTWYRSPKSGAMFLQCLPPLFPIRWRLHLYGKAPAMLAAKKRVARQIWVVGGFSHSAATWTAVCNSSPALSLQGSQPPFPIPVTPLSMPCLFLWQISL